MDYKIVLSVVASALVFIGYAPYIRDTLAGKTKPHVYTWGVGMLVTSISFWGQIIGKAGWALIIMGMVLTLCGIIFLLSLRFGVRKGTRLDKICLVVCLTALPVWAITKNPLAAVIIVNMIDAIAFIPTLTKSYRLPHSETLFSYQVNVVRFALNIVALSSFRAINLIYPVTWLICNSALAILIAVRRKKLAGSTAEFAG